ncbi:unnamed protein product, partial [Meganyctiphanes norvegica]
KMYAGNESNKDTLHVSPHIAAHRSSPPGPLSAHIPTYRVGTQSVLNLKSMDMQSSQGVVYSSSNLPSHLSKNGPQDLSAHSSTHVPEKGTVTSVSTHYQKNLPHIHTVVSQGMSSTQLLPAHITDRTSYYRMPDSVVGIQAPSAILVSTNAESYLPDSQSSQTSVIGHNGTNPNLGISSTTGLPAPLPAHSSSSTSPSYGNAMQINSGTIFRIEKNSQRLENLTTMTSHTPPPQQIHQQQHQQQLQLQQQQPQQQQQQQQQHQQPQQQQQHQQAQSHQHQEQQEQQHQQQHQPQHPHQLRIQHEHQSHQQQQVLQQQSEHQQQQPQPQQQQQHQQQQPQQQQQLSSFTTPQRTDLVQQALRAVVSNPNQTGNDNKEVIEYNYSAGDIAELLMMNIQVSASLQASIKQTGTTTSIVTPVTGVVTPVTSVVTPVTGVTTGPLSDINNESQ